MYTGINPNIHIGIECEGRFRGLKTVFVDAPDLTIQNIVMIKGLGINHICISDRYSTLDYKLVSGAFPDHFITLDVMRVKGGERPANMTIILTLPDELWESVNRLRPDDQVKFHSRQRDVLCTTARNFVRTDPSEFNNDKDLEP